MSKDEVIVRELFINKWMIPAYIFLIAMNLFLAGVLIPLLIQIYGKLGEISIKIGRRQILQFEIVLLEIEVVEIEVVPEFINLTKTGSPQNLWVILKNLLNLEILLMKNVINRLKCFHPQKFRRKNKNRSSIIL